jgi:hypothetical protein
MSVLNANIMDVLNKYYSIYVIDFYDGKVANINI